MQSGISLKVQLYGLIAALLVIAYVSALYTNVSGMKAYQEQQLTSHAQDAAHNLGLAISSHLDDPDLIVAETMANAIFDSGYYKQLYFTDADGKRRFERKNPEQQHDVPDWFIHQFRLNPPVMHSEVSNGWIPGGILSIQSHPGHSYSSLWTNSVNLASHYLWLLVLALLVSYLILKAVLKPLERIKQQALKVSQKQYQVIEKTPFTRELRAVTEGFNQMIKNVERSFTEQTQLASALSNQLYQDELTKLPNRQALTMQFEGTQKEAEKNHDSVYLGLVRLPSLQDVNTQQGYKAGDDYLVSCANLISETLTNKTQTRLYRLSGSELASLCLVSFEQLQELAKTLEKQLERQPTNFYPHGYARCFFTKVNPQEKLGESLSRLDTLHLTNDTTQAVVVDNETQGQSRHKWTEVLASYTSVSQSLKEFADENDLVSKCESLSNHFELLSQSIIDNEHKAIYEEILIRFKWQQSSLSTFETFCMAEKLQLSTQLQRVVMTYVIGKLIQQNGNKCGINLSDGFVADETQHQWLQNLLSINLTRSYVFEFNESALLHHPLQVKQLTQRLKEMGHQVCVEHFGAHLSSFNSIANLNIDFIKIDGSLIRAVTEEKNRFFVQSLSQICHGIGIDVLASHIENEELLSSCKSLGIDGYQGNHIHTPETKLLK